MFSNDSFAMIDKYSLAFIPDTLIVEKVKEMKMQLAAVIGWFPSKNALAHITVGEFEIATSAMDSITTQLTQIATTIQPVEVTLDAFGTYPNGAFFLSPTAISKASLQPIMKTFQKRLQVPAMYKSSDPHLSIARKLDANQIAIANSLWELETLTFKCESIALRKLDPVKKQFEIIATFPFLGETTPEVIQTSLF